MASSATVAAAAVAVAASAGEMGGAAAAVSVGVSFDNLPLDERLLLLSFVTRRR